LRYHGGGWPSDSKSAIWSCEAKLRPLIPSVTAATAAIWRARADSGIMVQVRDPNVKMIEISAREYEGQAALEPPRGNAAAAIKLLRGLGFRKFPECAPMVLHGLASGKVIWPSDNSVSAPAAIEGDLSRPPQPSLSARPEQLAQTPQLQPPQSLQFQPPPPPPRGSQLVAMVDGWSDLAAPVPVHDGDCLCNECQRVDTHASKRAKERCAGDEERVLRREVRASAKQWAPGTDSAAAAEQSFNEGAAIQVTATAAPLGYRNELHSSDGTLHTVIRGAVQIGGTLKDELKESMRKSASYNEPDGDVLGDKYRQTRSIIDPLRKKLQTSIMAALDRCNIRDDRDRCDVAVLDSLPEEFNDDGVNDHQIPIHCDDTLTQNNTASPAGVPMYDRSAPGYSDKKVRLSAIVAVEEGSKLFIYAAQDGPRIATVLLNVGDMVVFRGDCWHAGAKYRCPNRRLHVYVYHSSNSRARGDTYY